MVALEQPIDRRSNGSRRSPHALVQEYQPLRCLWGIVTNGARLRLLRNSARLARPTYLESDLRGMVERQPIQRVRPAVPAYYTAPASPTAGPMPTSACWNATTNKGSTRAVARAATGGVKAALRSWGRACWPIQTAGSCGKR